MFLNSSQPNYNVIQPLPCFRTTRFGRQIGLDDDNDGTPREYKVNKINKNVLKIIEINEYHFRFFNHQYYLLIPMIVHQF
jgi:hypothetical protein